MNAAIFRFFFYFRT
ncbi:pheST operon leader peptide PheM [Erwinia sp. HR93]|nr:pheST operon leader peptide PheM [Erwinia sp. HR93]EHJ9838251.1 pheST operon leader peptide PheM [Salmonella enterica]EHL7445408.1 pheST operon leader peptide PheM [Salmonella enterica]MEA1064906.1 pheST operon leader peptide PheM [Erwinia sp. HR93]